jgi:diacylglycerol kinase family enzyme
LNESRKSRYAAVVTGRLPVLINGRGGAASKLGDKLEGLVEEAMAKAGAQADIHILDAQDLSDAIDRAAVDSPRIVIAGGDGTISAAAQIIAGSQIEMGILPLGTLNHFARDLGIPDDLAEAARLAVNGVARLVDIAQVNEKSFINNASVGLYPFMVQSRDDIRQRRGLPKWLATVPASLAALSRLKHHRLRIGLGGGERTVVTPLLFVGINVYSLERGALGSRESLSGGQMSVYAVARSGRLAFLWFGVRALAGMTNRAKDFAALGGAEQLIVKSAGHSIEVGIDGEIERLNFPLEFRILPKALRVVAPPSAQNE